LFVVGVDEVELFEPLDVLKVVLEVGGQDDALHAAKHPLVDPRRKDVEDVVVQLLEDEKGVGEVVPLHR